MPFCKYCHRAIEKYDNDLCPHCGGLHPIDSEYHTMDVTTNIAMVEGGIDLPKARKQKTAAILCATLGYFGAHDFYIYKNKQGIINIIVTILFVAGAGTGLYFTILPSFFSYLIPFAVIWLFYVAKGILFGKFDSPKDGRGDFLR